MNRPLMLVALLAALVAAGCQTQQIEEMNYAERKLLADAIIQRCIDYGVDIQSKEFETCALMELQSEHLKRRNNLAQARRTQAALAQGMQNVSDSYNRAAANTAAMNRPVTCSQVQGPVPTVRCY